MSGSREWRRRSHRCAVIAARSARPPLRAIVHVARARAGRSRRTTLSSRRCRARCSASRRAPRACVSARPSWRRRRAPPSRVAAARTRLERALLSSLRAGDRRLSAWLALRSAACPGHAARGRRVRPRRARSDCGPPCEVPAPPPSVCQSSYRIQRREVMRRAVSSAALAARARLKLARVS